MSHSVTCLLADTTPNLPPPENYQAIGWIMVAVFTLSGGLYYFLKLLDRVRGKEPHPPNEQLDQAQTAMIERIDKLEKDNQEIWRTMRAEDNATRLQLNKAIQDFEGALGILDGTLKQVDQTMRLLLERQLK